MSIEKVVKTGGKVGGVANFALPIIMEVLEHLNTREEERTKREIIWSKRDVLVTALNNEKDVMLAYFEHRFKERHGVLEQYYYLLQRAVDTSNDKALQGALSGILGIIQENPLSDFAEFKKNMSNPDFVIEL